MGDVEQRESDRDFFCKRGMVVLKEKNVNDDDDDDPSPPL